MFLLAGWDAERAAGTGMVGCSVLAAAWREMTQGNVARKGWINT